MCRPFSCFLTVIGAIGAASSCAADDAITSTLEAAKFTYAEETDKIRAAVLDFFDKREDTARKAGNKKLVDEIKADRNKFEQSKDIPNSLPAVLKNRITKARGALESAYKRAIKEYTAAKQDEEATATEKELESLMSGRVTDSRKRWVHPKGEFRKINDGSWQEKSGDGTIYLYKETERTKDYVQIDAISGDVKIRYRLSDTRADMSYKPSQEYKPVFIGKWESNMREAK